MTNLSRQESSKLIRKLYEYIERHESHLYWGGACSKSDIQYRSNLIKEAVSFIK